MTTLFVSDLHLSNERPYQLELFREFMAGPAQRAGTLYILGDLTEVWGGDDDRTPPHPLMIDILLTFTRNGGRLYVMRGNRDFLMGERFCNETGAHLLADPSEIELNGRRVLVMHGDLLCTQDTGYQRYRRLVHSPLFQTIFLSIPAFLRISIAHGFRRLTQRLGRGKLEEITDVDPLTVRDMMQKHDVSLLIHGHTHRPGIHDFELDGRPARRIVIGDWYEQDSVLVSDDEGERLVRVREIL
ncbi:MAG: UDP-2,3-diacylglucosamine diphosphatase [Gammaproteobacteria bacterium]|nr:UDP-2,3-diacylglucosamine diphosphatase [Gammaproteobacteria bacterium]